MGLASNVTVQLLRMHILKGVIAYVEHQHSAFVNDDVILHVSHFPDPAINLIAQHLSVTVTSKLQNEQQP